MYGQLFRFDPGRILQEAYPSGMGILVPGQFGANVTLLRGQAVAQKTSDLKMYPFNPSASDGTQTFGGWSQYDFATDANGIVYFVTGGTAAGQSFFSSGQEYASIWRNGVFDPNYLQTAPSTGTPTAEVDTITPTNPTTGDIYSVYNASGVGVAITVGATQTATATVTLLKNAWNADPACTALATASGTSTFILTAVNKGIPLNLTATAVGTGTVALVITTAAVGGVTAEVDTFTPSAANTGDVLTVTITYPNLATQAVSYTVLSSDTTVTLVCTGLRNAWNASGPAANYAAASGTSTFILTSNTPGSSMTLTPSIVTSGGTTFTKSVTTAAYGVSFSAITPSRGNAYVEQPTGFWVFP